MRAVAARWKWIAAGAAILSLLALFVPATQTIAWVGSKDLEVVFVVSDVATGQPIPDATLSVHNPHPTHRSGDEYTEKDFRRAADGEVRIQFLRKKCMCSGHQNWREDTFAIHVPDWYVQASSLGYEPSEWLPLEENRLKGQLNRGGECARWTVAIKLRR